MIYEGYDMGKGKIGASWLLNCHLYQPSSPPPSSFKQVSAFGYPFLFEFAYLAYFNLIGDELT
jgi:hypothetical protein